MSRPGSLHGGCCFVGSGADLPAGGSEAGSPGQLRERGDGWLVRPVRHRQGRPPAFHLQTRQRHRLSHLERDLRGEEWFWFQPLRPQGDDHFHSIWFLPRQSDRAALGTSHCHSWGREASVSVPFSFHVPLCVCLVSGASGHCP